MTCLALNVHQERSVPTCTALTSLTHLFPSLSTLPFLSSYLDYLYPQDPHLRLIHPSRSLPLCNLNYHFLCQPTPPSFHLANFGCTNGLWELKMSQEWVNVGSMSAVSRSNSCPNPPLSPFLHFRSHFFHLNNSFVSHRIATRLHLYIGPGKCWNTCAAAIRSFCPLLSMSSKTHNGDAVFIQHSKVSFN